MLFYSCSKKNKLITFIFCLPFLSAFYAFAAAETDCVEAGGKAHCITPEKSQWNYRLCDYAGAYGHRIAAWCRAKGGTFHGMSSSPVCSNTGAVTEQNYINVSVAFTKEVDNLCKVTAPSPGSWGNVPGNNLCGGAELKFDNGIEVSSGQILNISGFSQSRSSGNCDQPAGETIYVSRYRKLECPNDYQMRTNADGNKECYKVSEFVASPKENGSAQTCQTPSEGEPIRIGTGNMYHIDTDLSGPLPLVRTYNSSLGKWTFNTAIHLQPAGNVSVLHLGDGKQYTYKKVDDHWASDPDVYHHLEEISEQNAVWRITFADSSQALFNNEGQILEFKKPQGESITYEHTYNRTTITDAFENTLVLDFDSLHQLVKATLNDSASVSYTYDAQQRLVKTTFPDQSTRQFLYENTDFPHYLTGVMDGKGNRAITWTYDSAGRAIVSERADNNEKFAFEYNDNQTTVTNPLGKKTTYTFENFYGIKKVVRVEGHASSNCTAANKSYTYFDNGLLKSKTDWKGVITSYEYNDRGLLTREVVANGTTDEREILTEWHETFRLPTRTTEANRTTQYVYDDQGRLSQQTVTADSNDTGNTSNNSTGTSGNSNENGNNSSSNNGNGSTTEQPGLKDSDNDGLSDDYETLYGLNPNKHDSGEDTDNDGITNLEEFYRGLNPNVPDQLSTSLNNAIQLLSPIRHFVADDITGVALKDRSSHTNGILLSISDQGQIEDSLTNSTNPWVSAKSFDLNGAHYLAMGPVKAKTVDNGFTWMGWMTLDSTQDFQRLFSVGNGKADNIITFFFNKKTTDVVIGLFNGSDYVLRHQQATNLTAGQPLFMAMTYQNGHYQVFLNGRLLFSKTGPKPNSIDRKFFNIGYSQWNKANGSAAGVNGLGVSDLKFQRIALFNKTLSSSEISMLSTLSQPKKNSDFDHDGMPDEFESKYGLNIYQNDANDDADNDGLSNLEEYNRGLNPTIDENASLELNNKIKALSPIRHFVADDIVGSSVPDRSGHKDASLISVSDQEASSSNLSSSDTPKIASKSFDLNGSHYLAMGPFEAETIDNGFTWMGWMTLDSTQDFQRLFSVGNGKADNIITFFFNKKTTDVVIGLFNGSDYVLRHQQATNLTAGQPLFMAMTYQNGHYQVFLNGRLLFSKTGPKPNSIDRKFFNIGYSQWNKANGSAAGVNGLGVSDLKFQRIAIFDKALSEAQINSLNTF